VENRACSGNSSGGDLSWFTAPVLMAQKIRRPAWWPDAEFRK
jgi:hypothetical protein